MDSISEESGRRPDFKTAYLALMDEVQAFTDAEAAVGEDEPADFATVASWRALQPRLATFRRPASRRWQIPATIAASFLVTALGSSFWIASQKRLIAELREPRPNVAIYDLVSSGQRAGGSHARNTEISQGAGSVLILTPEVDREYPGYEAKFLDSGDSPVRSISGLEMDPESETFTLWIPPRFLPPGNYRIELHGLEGERGERIVTHAIRLTEP